MNGVAPPRLWQEAKNPEGRVYYYNTQTKATQWTKPEELMSSAERALSSQPWKEYTAEGGRKYWYNTETKTSSWEMPEAYKNALAQAEPPSRHPLPPMPVQNFVAGGPTNYNSVGHSRDYDDYNSNDRSHYDRSSGHTQSDSFKVPGPAQTESEYTSYEEAESAFFKLLRRSGVQPGWTWQQAMKATVKDPQYRALRDPKDRKAAFEKYIVEYKAQEQDKLKERMVKLRMDFSTMLRSHPEIKHYTRWRTALPIIEGETIFRSTDDEGERRQLFNEYIIELKRNNREAEVSSRKAAMEGLSSILDALKLEPYTRWSDVQNVMSTNERFQNDKKFQTLTKADVLKAFEDHIKSLERNFNDSRQKQKMHKARRERQRREQFIALLRELRSNGKIKAGSQWKDIHHLVEKDRRYRDMLGQAGSTPLDLFWDILEEEERVLRNKQYEVTDVLDERGFEISNKRTLEDFLSVMKADRRTANIDSESLALIFQRLRAKAARQSEEDKHHSERHQRRAVDALRSRIKRLEPPVKIEDTWEQVRHRIEKFDEYRALESDELRLSAFEKVIRRLKGREEYERDRGTRDHRDHRDRERERERDRDRDRDNRSNGRHKRHRSRTPEPDAYEAERKKAQEQRERQYKKGSAMGLSPPPQPALRRPRDERREREDDRYVPRSSRYERDRRDRDPDRHAPGRSERGDLNYGELDANGGSSSRRRRDSDDGSQAARRESKRSRKEKTLREPTMSPRRKTRSPQVTPVPPKDDPALRSGSEEGEIEED